MEREQAVAGARWAPWVVVLWLGVMVGVLHVQGRIGWCVCGEGFWWVSGIWSSHNSQHLLDPYSYSHLLHGFLFWWVFRAVIRRGVDSWRLVAAVALEAVWELVENSRFVIQRYRDVTVGMGYEGDAVANSLSDVLCCAAGFLLARALGWKRALFWFVVLELFCLFWVRDNLSLNVLMLLWPVEAVKQWQMGAYLTPGGG